MSSFLSNASKRVTDVRAILRDSASGGSIKYVPEKGTRHKIYIPYHNVEVTDDSGNSIVVKEPIAISGNVHEWNTADGKFKATVCLKDVVRKDEDGNLLNDGSCPFCNRVPDAWDIANYRNQLEDAKCTLTGEERKKYLDAVYKDIRNERKAKAAQAYMYLLVVKFRTNNSDEPVIGQDKLPEYELRVMKLSGSRVEKIQQQLANSGVDMPGSELIFEYPNVDDKRLVVSQSTVAAVFPSNMLTVKYQGLLDKINIDVDKFEFDKIDKSFPEWGGMSTSEAEGIVNSMFEKWDEYQAELKTNPNAKYLEYVSNTAVTNPALDATSNLGIPAGQIAGVPLGAAPVIPGMNIEQALVAQTAPAAPVMPTAPVMDGIPSIDSVLGGNTDIKL